MCKDSTFTYSIQAWENKNVMASFSKYGYKTKGGAMRAFNCLKRKGIYQAINVREEEKLYNGWEISSPIVQYEETVQCTNNVLTSEN